MWEKLQQNPTERDRIIGALFVLCGLIFLHVGAYPLWANFQVLNTGGIAHLVLLLVASAFATQRSKRPLITLCGVVVCTMIDGLYGSSVGVLIVFTDTVYATIRYGRDSIIRPGVKIATALTVFVAVSLALVGVESATYVLFLQFIILTFVSAWWGYSVRNEQVRSRQQAQLEYGAHTAALRQNISHELHDLVSNRLAVIGLHAEAAKLQIAKMPSSSRQAVQLQQNLHVIKETATLAHTDLRSLMNTLMRPEDSIQPHQNRHEPFGSMTQLAKGQLSRLSDHLTGERHLLYDSGSWELLNQMVDELAGWQSAALIRILDELVHNSAKHGYGDTRISATVPADVSTDLSTKIDDGGFYQIQVHNEIAPCRAATDHVACEKIAPGQSGIMALAESLGGTCESQCVGNIWLAQVKLPLFRKAAHS